VQIVGHNWLQINPITSRWTFSLLATYYLSHIIRAIRPPMTTPRLKHISLPHGTMLTDRYRILERLGTGWEGEVYLIQELATGIERTAKLFLPHRNVHNRTLKFYARKLHKLRQCPIVIQYHSHDRFLWKGVPVAFLVSEFIEGEVLSGYIRRQSGHRLPPFQAVHLLHALAAGIECIHAMGEYHGDLHEDNIIVQRSGLGFDLKLIDLYRWGAPSAANIRYDVFMLIRLFYDALGGQRYYAKHPPAIKAICCGLKHSLIASKFRTAGQLRVYLETMDWD
jgi:tRNA A-37 threonylcarbamoyl transferase component Bud32